MRTRSSDIAATLLERQIFARVLPVTIAYHSPAMDPIKEEFLAAVAGLRGRATRIPWLSDTTGTWADGASCDADFWWRAIRQPVRFRDGIRQILDAGIAHFVEIAPHPVLASSVMDCMKEHGTKGVALPSLRRKDDEATTMRRSLGALYAAGCALAWPALREDGARVRRPAALSLAARTPLVRAGHRIRPPRWQPRGAGGRPPAARRTRALGVAGLGHAGGHGRHGVPARARGARRGGVSRAPPMSRWHWRPAPRSMATRRCCCATWTFTRALRLTDDDGTRLQCTLDAVRRPRRDLLDPRLGPARRGRATPVP